MPISLHIANSEASKNVCINADDIGVCLLQTKPMARKVKSESSGKPLHYLREWREFREMSQAELAEAVGTDKSVISLLEASAAPGREHKRGLSPKWARKLAKALTAQPGWLLDVDPNTVPTGLLEAWGAVPEELREQAMKTLVSFGRKAS